MPPIGVTMMPTLIWRTRPMRLIALLLMALALPAAAQDAPAPAQNAVDGTVAFLGITFIDDTLSAGSDAAAQTARIDLIEGIVADAFTGNDVELVDIAPVADRLDTLVNPAKCNGCDARIARELGADYALVGEVLKTSELILAMNLQLRDAETGKTVMGRVVDIRSNTDEAWARGMRYILKTAFFVPEKT